MLKLPLPMGFLDQPIKPINWDPHVTQIHHYRAALERLLLEIVKDCTFQTAWLSREWVKYEKFELGQSYVTPHKDIPFDGRSLLK